MTKIHLAFAEKSRASKFLPRLFGSAALFLLLVPVGHAPALAQATQYPNVPPLLLGAAWYPEQWPESQWEPDLERMEACHIHLVRVAEFAWSTIEPEEGKYDFTWLDHAIEKAAKHHIVVVLGTPTAAPPAWLTSKYPETLRVDEDGKRAEHGNRQQFSFSPMPSIASLPIASPTQMATRYGHNPNVVGWQLDNEYADPDFGPSAQTQFHAWLEKKYGTIAELNRRWTTTYWSQTYDNFDEIPVRASKERIPRWSSTGSTSSATPGRATRKTRSTPFGRMPTRGSSSPPTPWAGSMVSTTTSSIATSISRPGTTTSANPCTTPRSMAPPTIWIADSSTRISGSWRPNRHS
jgi:hypothetical protein